MGGFSDARLELNVYHLLIILSKGVVPWIGEAIHMKKRKFVALRLLSLFTIAAALLRKSGDTVYIGIDDHDLLAAQSFYGNSNILVAPAWRLPRKIASITS